MEVAARLQTASEQAGALGQAGALVGEAQMTWVDSLEEVEEEEEPALCPHLKAEAAAAVEEAAA